MINDLDKCIDIIKYLLVKDRTATFTNEAYVEFKNIITNFVFRECLKNTDEWKIISRSMIYKSNEYLSDIDANLILFNLEKLKRLYLENVRDKNI